MEELLTMEQLVKTTLENYPQTRNSDALLYITIINRMSPKTAKRSYEDVMLRACEMGLPNYDTVSRTRRKLQAKYKALQGETKVKKIRRDRYKVFKEYALHD